jgi:hypothetical protein
MLFSDALQQTKGETMQKKLNFNTNETIYCILATCYTFTFWTKEQIFRLTKSCYPTWSINIYWLQQGSSWLVHDRSAGQESSGLSLNERVCYRIFWSISLILILSQVNPDGFSYITCLWLTAHLYLYLPQCLFCSGLETKHLTWSHISH